jgi:hypothetical protein
VLDVVEEVRAVASEVRLQTKQAVTRKNFGEMSFSP